MNAARNGFLNSTIAAPNLFFIHCRHWLFTSIVFAEPFRRPNKLLKGWLRSGMLEAVNGRTWIRLCPCKQINDMEWRTTVDHMCKRNVKKKKWPDGNAFLQEDHEVNSFLHACSQIGSPHSSVQHLASLETRWRQHPGKHIRLGVVEKQVANYFYHFVCVEDRRPLYHVREPVTCMQTIPTTRAQTCQRDAIIIK